MSNDPEFRKGMTTGAYKCLDEKDLEVTHLRELVVQGLEVVEDFLPNIANCALQDYGRLNEFTIAAEAERKKTDGEETKSDG